MIRSRHDAGERIPHQSVFQDSMTRSSHDTGERIPHQSVFQVRQVDLILAGKVISTLVGVIVDYSYIVTLFITPVGLCRRFPPQCFMSGESLGKSWPLFVQKTSTTHGL